MHTADLVTDATAESITAAATSEAAIEAEIKAKGLTAPRITPEHIDAQIASVAFHVFPDSCLTVCCLTLANGYNVTGTSACASPANFDEEVGRKIAYRNARNEIGALEGYLLRSRLHGIEVMGQHDPVAAGVMATACQLAYMTPEQQLNMFEPEGQA